MSVSVGMICFAEDFQEHLAGHFHRKGYRVRPAQTASEILEYAATETLDVLLLDLTGEQRGLEIIQLIRSCCPELQVVVVVRKDDVQTSIAAMKAGAYDELSDPFDWNVLDSKIEAAFREKGKRKYIGKMASFRQKIEDYLTAAAMAEQGAPEAARSMLVERKGRQHKEAGTKSASASRMKKTIHDQE